MDASDFDQYGRIPVGTTFWACKRSGIWERVVVIYSTITSYWVHRIEFNDRGERPGLRSYKSYVKTSTLHNMYARRRMPMFVLLGED